MRLVYFLNKRSERAENDKCLKKTHDDFVQADAEKNWVCISDTDPSKSIKFLFSYYQRFFILLKKLIRFYLFFG